MIHIWRYATIIGVILGSLGTIFSSIFSAPPAPSASVLSTVDSNVSNTRIINSGNTHNEINLIKFTIQNLEKGIDKPTYQVQPHPNNEVVQGQRGKYFVIDLKDAIRKELILFEIGKYTKDEFERAFRNSMMNVKTDILDNLAKGNKPYKLYVKGSADIVGENQLYIGELIEGDTQEITFLKKKPNNPNQFIGEYSSQIVPKKFRNEHLPNLRGAYIQNCLKDSTLNEESTILEGSVTSTKSEEDRNALILLYIPE
jgi:hypothetical protein